MQGSKPGSRRDRILRASCRPEGEDLILPTGPGYGPFVSRSSAAFAVIFIKNEQNQLYKIRFIPDSEKWNVPVDI
jgi:hypothetical protein